MQCDAGFSLVPGSAQPSCARSTDEEESWMSVSRLTGVFAGHCVPAEYLTSVERGWRTVWSNQAFDNRSGFEFPEQDLLRGVAHCNDPSATGGTQAALRTTHANRKW